ncbi:ABATE domain-containing protein [Janibacter melonis]|uniref:CGNR zinc finger domain-containing protein n=1 Tax=Janibacter melonis TaxID=262209 RepID=UPI0020437AE0|nr:CGNR zinc finger domain-containing protein [Janibacter melonis]MCM3556840.1 ABATE domain-containing protein [Janibacter melonis]
MNNLPKFRSGNTLATTFSGTLTERLGKPVEWIPTEARLLDWLAVNGFQVRECSEEQLLLARELREAFHTVATAAATGEALAQGAVDIINDRSLQGTASALLSGSGERTWRLGPSARVDDALSVIAADAISLLSGERGGRIALCASPTCRAAFFDSSQSRTRRWCDMNTCGNRQKKARYFARPVA